MFAFSLSKSTTCAVLSGTKYGLKQTRGKFGLGAKMVSSGNYFTMCLCNSLVSKRFPICFSIQAKFHCC